MENAVGYKTQPEIKGRVLESLFYNGAVSATDFDRSSLERLVKQGLAIKHHNGTSITYSITAKGRTIRKAL